MHEQVEIVTCHAVIQPGSRRFQTTVCSPWDAARMGPSPVCLVGKSKVSSGLRVTLNELGRVPVRDVIEHRSEPSDYWIA